MSTPQISVVVIFLNEEQFLAEAIESVFAQTFADWELILVDDGSSDGSVEAARLACEERPHQVRLLQHPGCANMGMSASRNLGIGHCRGEWISFLDGDDVWLPQKLERQVAVSEEAPGVDIVVSPAKLWRTWSTDSSDAVDDVQRFRMEAGVIAEPPALVEGFLEDEMTSVCDLLARRSVVEQVGGYETEFTGMFEDQVFHVKLLRNRSAAVTGFVGYQYRQHRGSTTAQAHSARQHLQARRRFLAWCARYLRSEREESPKAGLDVLRWKVHHERRKLLWPLLRSTLGALRRRISSASLDRI